MRAHGTGVGFLCVVFLAALAEPAGAEIGFSDSNLTLDLTRVNRAWADSDVFSLTDGTPEGACCLTGDACSVMTEELCGAHVPPGVYLGDGTACDPDLCLTGACYINCVCVNNQIESVCQAVGAWQGAGTSCPGCCLADGSCVTTTNPLCCENTVSACLGDSNDSGVDDACQAPPGTSSMSIDRWWGYIDEPILVTLTVNVTSADVSFLHMTQQDPLGGWKLVDDAFAMIDGKATGPFSSGGVSFDPLTPGGHRIVIHSLVAPSEPTIERIGFSLYGGSASVDEIASINQMFIADRAALFGQLARGVEFVDGSGTLVPIYDVGQLVSTFSPNLYFDFLENFFPQVVETTLADSRQCDDMTEHVILHAGVGEAFIVGPSASDLVTFATKYGSDEGLNNLWLNLPCDAPGPLNVGHGDEGFSLYATAIQEFDPLRGKETIAISYYIHYGYSNWRAHGGYNDHEGDWECAFVYLTQDGPGLPFAPEWVAYCQHEKNSPTAIAGGGQWAQWTDLRTAGLIDSDTHPRLYVGRGAHASYFSEGCTPVTNLPGSLFDYDECHVGDFINPPSQGSVILLPRVGEIADESTPGSWLVFPGHWGQSDLGGFWQGGDDGPLGPVFTKATTGGWTGQFGRRWFDPIGWPTTGLNFQQWELSAGTLGMPCDEDSDCRDLSPCTQDKCVSNECAHPYEPAGLPCRDQTDTVCDHPDSCDGFGACGVNHDPEGAFCLDDKFCNGLESCHLGVCVGDLQPVCDASVLWCAEIDDKCIEHGDGDFNDNFVIDLDDYAEFHDCFGHAAAPDCYPANMTGSSGTVDLADFAAFQRAFDGMPSRR